MWLLRFVVALTADSRCDLNTVIDEATDMEPSDHLLRPFHCFIAAFLCFLVLLQLNYDPVREPPNKEVIGFCCLSSSQKRRKRYVSVLIVLIRRCRRVQADA